MAILKELVLIFLLADRKVGIKIFRFTNRELWPKNSNYAKLQYIQMTTKLFAYDGDTKTCKYRLDKLAISIASS